MMLLLGGLYICDPHSSIFILPRFSLARVRLHCKTEQRFPFSPHAANPYGHSTSISREATTGHPIDSSSVIIGCLDI